MVWTPCTASSGEVSRSIGGAADGNFDAESCSLDMVDEQVSM